jgi:hypothetical protein
MYVECNVSTIFILVWTLLYVQWNPHIKFALETRFPYLSEKSLKWVLCRIQTENDIPLLIKNICSNITKRGQIYCHIHYLIESIQTSLCSSKLKPEYYYDRTNWYKRRQKAVCCSLVSSTSSMGRSGELSDSERGLVIGCHISKKSVRDIATLLNLPRLAVGDVIVKLKRESTTTMKPLPGRPCLMTDRDRRPLKKVIREIRQTLSETITREFCSATSCPASTMTVCQELRGMRFHGRAAAHKPNILPMNAKRCLKWYKGDATGQWTAGNVWFGVMNHTLPCGVPMGGFGCGKCLENDTCQHM